MRILAVDDDEIILELLKGVVASVGFNDITLVSSGENALRAIEESAAPFDCFLLDIQMPEMDGIELCHRIRKTPKHKKTPILMITAMADKKYVDRAFDAGASDYVTKPFDVLELGTRVQIAAQMSEQQHVVEEQSFAVEELRNQINQENARPLTNSIPINDIVGGMEKLAFENYFLQLSRSGMFGSTVAAIKVSNIADIYSRSRSDEFSNFIEDISEAISDNFRGKEFFFTYRGNGIFSVIVHKMSSEEWDEISDEISRTVREMGLCYSNGSSVKPWLIYGKPIKNGFFNAANSLEPLWKALDTLEKKDVDEKRPSTRKIWSTSLAAKCGRVLFGEIGDEPRAVSVKHQAHAFR